MWNWIMQKYAAWKFRRMMKKKIEQLKKDDPFIYD